MFKDHLEKNPIYASSQTTTIRQLLSNSDFPLKKAYQTLICFSLQYLHYVQKTVTILILIFLLEMLHMLKISSEINQDALHKRGRHSICFYKTLNKFILSNLWVSPVGITKLGDQIGAAQLTIRRPIALYVTDNVSLSLPHELPARVFSTLFLDCTLLLIFLEC